MNEPSTFPKCRKRHPTIPMTNPSIIFPNAVFGMVCGSAARKTNPNSRYPPESSMSIVSPIFEKTGNSTVSAQYEPSPNSVTSGESDRRSIRHIPHTAMISS